MTEFYQKGVRIVDTTLGDNKGHGPGKSWGIGCGEKKYSIQYKHYGCRCYKNLEDAVKDVAARNKDVRAAVKEMSESFGNALIPTDGEFYVIIEFESYTK